MINLTSGLEDPERATIAFLVGTAAQAAGNEALAFFTMDAVRLAFRDAPESVPQQEGRPSFAELWKQFADAGGLVYLCPFCVTSRELGDEPLPNAVISGATPLWEWIGEGATVFSY